MQTEKGDQRPERIGRRVLQDRAPRTPRDGGDDRLHGRGRDVGSDPRRDQAAKSISGRERATAHAKVQVKEKNELGQVRGDRRTGVSPELAPPALPPPPPYSKEDKAKVRFEIGETVVCNLGTILRSVIPSLFPSQPGTTGSYCRRLYANTTVVGLLRTTLVVSSLSCV